MNKSELISTSRSPIYLFGKVIAHRYYSSVYPFCREERINRKHYIELCNYIANINGFGWIKKKGLFGVSPL